MLLIKFLCLFVCLGIGQAIATRLEAAWTTACAPSHQVGDNTNTGGQEPLVPLSVADVQALLVPGQASPPTSLHISISISFFLAHKKNYYFPYSL